MRPIRLPRPLVRPPVPEPRRGTGHRGQETLARLVRLVPLVVKARPHAFLLTLYKLLVKSWGRATVRKVGPRPAVSRLDGF